MTAHDRRALTDQIEATRERAKHTLENYHHDGRAGLGARDVLALASTVEQLAVELDRLRKAEGRECEGYRRAAIRLAAMVADLLDGIIEADYDPRPWSYPRPWPYPARKTAARAEYLRGLSGLTRRPDPTTPRPV